MAFTLSTYSLAGIGALLACSLGAVAYLYYQWKRAESKLVEEELEALTVSKFEEEKLEHGELVDIEPPQVRTGGLVCRLYKQWNYDRQRRKLLGKGYVQWVLITDGWPTPRFVKPVSEGGGIPKLEYDGVAYLFPTSATLPDEQTGLRTIVHKKGESDPINLEVPNELAIRADVLSEYLTNELVSEAPEGGFWEIDIGLTPNQMLFGAIGLMMLLSFAYQWYTGGL